MLKHQLKKLREERKISQIELAKRIKISKFHLNRIENGKRGLNVKLAMSIAKELGVTIDDIFLNDN